MDAQTRRKLENRTRRLVRNLGELAKKRPDMLALIWIGVNNWEKGLEESPRPGLYLNPASAERKATMFQTLLEGLPDAEIVARNWVIKQETPLPRTMARRRLQMAVDIVEIQKEGGTPRDSELYPKESEPVVHFVREQIRSLQPNIEGEIDRYQREGVREQRVIIEGQWEAVGGSESKG